MYICKQTSNLPISVDGNFIVLVSQALTSESSWIFVSLTPLPYLVHQQVCQLFCQNGSRPFLTTSITTILFQGTIHARDYLHSNTSPFTARDILLQHHLVRVILLPKSSREAQSLQWPTESYKICLPLLSLLSAGICLLALPATTVLPHEVPLGLGTCSCLVLDRSGPT